MNEEIETPVFNTDIWTKIGLSAPSLECVQKAGFLEPTPVQVESIPEALKGSDLLVSAKTGSGKTASFVLPIVEKIRGRKGTLALILCPVREIALQTQETLTLLAQPQGLQTMAAIGGVNMREEEERIKSYPQIIVGTPGRIADHVERGNLWLEYVEIVVLDEADRMLDMGFAKQLNTIMDMIPKSRQTLFFSATIAGETEKLAQKYLNNPKRIALGSAVKVADTISQELLWLNPHAKIREVANILHGTKESTIIFTRTKLGAHKLWTSLRSYGILDAGYLTSDKAQKERERVLQEFKDGNIRVLIATDVAGRGIHVEDVGHVINFDFPLEPEDYVHRVGRTGRKGKSGKATTFVTPEDSKLLLQIEKIIGNRIPETRAHDYEARMSRRERSSSGRRPTRGRTGERSRSDSRTRGRAAGSRR